MRLRSAGILSVALLLGSSIPVTHILAQPRSAQQRADAVIAAYYTALNKGLKSGDFAAMAPLYASDATMLRSTPQGETVTFHGINAIMAYYRVASTKFPGFQFTQDSLINLSPTAVFVYEHASNRSLTVPTRCTHLFVLRDGKITTLYWVAYFAGR